MPPSHPFPLYCCEKIPSEMEIAPRYTVVTVYTVDILDMAYTFDMVYTVDMVYDRATSCSKIKNFHGTEALVD